MEFKELKLIKLHQAIKGKKIDDNNYINKYSMYVVEMDKEFKYHVKTLRLNEISVMDAKVFSLTFNVDQTFEGILDPKNKFIKILKDKTKDIAMIKKMMEDKPYASLEDVYKDLIKFSK